MPMKLFSRQRWEYQAIHRLQDNEQTLHKNVLRYTAMTRLYQGIACFILIGPCATWALISGWQMGVMDTSTTIYVYLASWNITLMTWMTSSSLPDLFKLFGTLSSFVLLLYV